MSLQAVMVGIYILGIVGLAFYLNKREVRNKNDFLLAGQRLSLPVVIGTLVATWVGSGSLVGGAGFVYQYGPLAAIFYFAGGPLGIIVMYFLASKTRKLSKGTIPELLEMRFGGWARTFSTVFILLTYVSVLSYQFISGGYVLELTIGLPSQYGAFLTFLVVILLAATGGLFSVAYTDFVSSIIIIIGLLVGLPFVLVEVGGVSAVASQLPQAQLTWTGGLTVVQIIGYFLPLFVYIIADQNMLQRFAASKNESVAKKSTIGFFLGVFLIYSLITIFSTISIILFKGINPDTALVTIANDGLPAMIGSLFMVSFAALLITTASSFLLSASSNAINDLYMRVIQKDISEKNIMVITRLAVVGMGVFSYLLGLFFTSVLEMSVFAYTMYATAITPVVLAALFWKRATPVGAIVSILSGGLATILWEALGRPMGWNAIIVSLPLSVMALIIGSLLTKNKDTSQNLNKNKTSQIS